jgi:hypothetical protein
MNQLSDTNKVEESNISKPIVIGKQGENTVEINNLTSINELLDETDKLFNEYKSKKYSIDDLNIRYRNFRLTYPIIYRLIIENGEYSRKYFGKYLKLISERNKNKGSYWKDAKQFAESQSTYMLDLFKSRKPKPTAKQLLEYKKIMHNTIESEWKLIEKNKEMLENVRSEDIYKIQLCKDIKKLLGMSKDELMRLQEPNWSAAYGLEPPECS